jgi:hypothetical protein
VRWGDRGGPGSAQVFGQPGRLNKGRRRSGAVVLTNEGATDPYPGPPRPTRSTFCGNEQRAASLLNRGPNAGGGPGCAGGGRGGSSCVCPFGACGRKRTNASAPGAVGPKTLRKTGIREAARAPAQPPSSPAPAPTAQPQTDRRSPAARRRPAGWGELCLHLDAQVAPPPSRAGAPPACASRRIPPTSVRWLFHRATTERNGRAVAAMRLPTAGRGVSPTVPS